jgi:hypothetical protein
MTKYKGMKSSIRFAIFIAGLLFATNMQAQNAAAKEPAVDTGKAEALQPKPTDKTGIPNSKPPSSTPVKKDAGTKQTATEKAVEPTGRPKTSTLELPQTYKTVE